MRDWRRYAWIALAVLAAFIIGFAWQGIRAAQLETRLGEARQALALHRLEGSLSAALFEAQRGSFEIARQHASDFYTGLQRTVPNAPEAARSDLAGILAQRDQMITMLSRGDPESGDILSGTYARYRTARARAEQELPRAR